MPTLLFIFGLRFYFYSEEHLPIHIHIHIHVQNSDGKAKIDVETCMVLENRGIKPKDLKRATDAVLLYKEDIIKAWNEYFDE